MWRTVCLAWAAAGCVVSAQAADHALVLTIGRYADGQALPGVARDRDSALRMVERLGLVPGPRVATPTDAALDLAGLQRSFNRLADEVQPGDRVFIYYSGHGTSSTVAGRCEQGLLAHDGRVFGAGEMSRYLARITDRAAQVVMVLDACYAGGVAGVGATRAIGSSFPSGWRPKYASSKADGTPDQCAQPTNLLDLVPQRTRGAVNLERNFLYIAAARKDEVAFDHEQTGGLATTALLSCMEGPASGNGPVDFAALAACAQSGVERALPADPRLKPQHLVLAGNEALALNRATPAAVTPAAHAPAAGMHATVARILAGADAAWPVTLQAMPAVLTIRQDMLSLRVTSPREGYLSLFYLGSDGKDVAPLYPTRASDAAYVRAGVPFDVPRRWRSEGPAGTNQIVAVVAPRPRTLADWRGTGGMPAAPPPGCTRNLSSSVDCGPAPGTDDGTYGAALINVREQP